MAAHNDTVAPPRTQTARQALLLLEVMRAWSRREALAVERREARVCPERRAENADRDLKALPISDNAFVMG